MHTKGPWSYGGYCRVNSDEFRVAVCHDKGTETIAHVYGESSKVAVPRARLIAAAPELLEALELCYEHCRLYHPEVETNNVGEQVRAAIKKARG